MHESKQLKREKYEKQNECKICKAHKWLHFHFKKEKKKEIENHQCMHPVLHDIDLLQQKKSLSKIKISTKNQNTHFFHSFEMKKE